MTRGNLLLTGATGILGSWVMADALRRGVQPIALMRDSSAETARERLAAVLELAGLPGAEADVRIVHGDAAQPGMGMAAAERRELQRSADAILHCAACTSFADDQDAEILATNVGGVESMVAFAEGAEAPLYHVSTAYVAGRRTGRVLESELEHSAGFKNTYEKSKCRSERIVRDAFASGRVHGAIFRPAIIVGEASTGRICQFINFYSFLQVLEFAVLAKRRGMHHVQLGANPECTKNLAPVDWTAQAMWRIIDQAGPSGMAYHLTNPNPPTLGYLGEWGNAVMAEHGVTIGIGDEEPAMAATFKKAMRGAYEPFQQYLAAEPTFDRTHTDAALDGELPFPAIDFDVLNTLFAHAQSRRWRSVFGKRPAAAAARKAAVA